MRGVVGEFSAYIRIVPAKVTRHVKIKYTPSSDSAEIKSGRYCSRMNVGVRFFDQRCPQETVNIFLIAKVVPFWPDPNSAC